MTPLRWHQVAAVILIGLAYISVLEGLTQFAFADSVMQENASGMALALSVLGTFVLGDRIALWFLGARAHIVDGSEFAALPAGAGPIARHANVRVAVVNDARRFACTLGAGARPTVFISTGMLRDLPPDATVAVLAHEAAHAVLRHNLLQGVAVALAIAVKVSVGLSGWLLAAVILGYLFAMRMAELQADRLAAAWLSPSAIAEALEDFVELTKAGELPQWADWFSTHPALHRRIKALRRVPGKA
jgi:Zn-dependent protease with chaperone function